jgi:hypothetical protein
MHRDPHPVQRRLALRRRVSRFLESLGRSSQPWQAVTLPHGAMLGGTRDPNGEWDNGLPRM